MSSRKKIIIHMGLHKTATTSIQYYLSNNIHRLRHDGFDYPLFNLANGESTINHSHILYSLYSEKPHVYFQNLKREIDAEVANDIYLKKLSKYLKSNDRNIIFSAEDLSLARKNKLKEFSELLKNHGYDVSVLLFVRNPRSYVCSAIQQRVLIGAVIDDVKLGLTSRRLKNIIEVFDNVVIYKFEDACSYKYGPVGFFLKRVGLEWEKNYKFSKMNESLSHTATMLLSHINYKVPLRNKEFINADRIKVNYLYQFLKTIQGNRFTLTGATVENIDGIVKEDIEEIRRLTGIDYIDDNKSYDDSICSASIVCAIHENRYFNKLSYNLKRTIYEFLVINLDRKLIDKLCEDIFNALNENKESARLYRDVAILLEPLSVRKSFYFMSRAGELRPNGNFIQNKIHKYKLEIKGV
jgi:hypothetical protein